MGNVKPLATVSLILGLTAAIVLGAGLWIVLSIRETRATTAASKACVYDQAVKRAPLGSSARADAYERCLIAHGVPANSIPKRTDLR